MVNIELLKEKIEESGMTKDAICKKSGITKKTARAVVAWRDENGAFTDRNFFTLKVA